MLGSGSGNRSGGTGSVVPRSRVRPKPPPRIPVTPLRACSTDNNNNNKRFHFFQVVLFSTFSPLAPLPVPPPRLTRTTWCPPPPFPPSLRRRRRAVPRSGTQVPPPARRRRRCRRGAEGRRLDGAGRRRRPRRPRPWPGTGGPRPAPPVRRAGIGGRRHMTGHVLEAAQSKRKWGLV